MGIKIPENQFRERVVIGGILICNSLKQSLRNTPIRTIAANSPIKLHIRHNKNIRNLFLTKLIIYSSLKNHIEDSLNVSVRTLSILIGFNKILPKSRITHIHILRARRESDILILKGPILMLSKINCQSVSDLKSSSRGLRVNITRHTARTICYHNGITIAIYKVRKSLPHLLKSGVLVTNSGFVIFLRKILMNDVMRERSRRINLSFTSSQRIKICLTTLRIMLKESILINKVSLRGNLFIVDSLPVVGRHLTLNDVDILTTIGQGSTIVTRSHAKSLAGLGSQLTRLGRRSILRLKPLKNQTCHLFVLLFVIFFVWIWFS